MNPADKVIVYENPLCSKCRDLKQVLNNKRIAFESINYMEKPLSAHSLRQLLAKAGLQPREALRTNEPSYRQHVESRELTDEQLLQVMAAHPELIQRPIVVKGDKAVLARPLHNLSNLGID